MTTPTKEKIMQLKAELWATSTLLAIATGDQSHAKDKTIRDMTAEEWRKMLPGLREQFGIEVVS